MRDGTPGVNHSMLRITDCAGAGAATALLCAIGLPAGSLFAQVAWTLVVLSASIAIIAFAWERWSRIQLHRRRRKNEGR
jgi:hypothetical protein